MFFDDSQQQLSEGWATKYRPRTLADYRGTSVVDVLKRRLSNPTNRPHVILIQGTRGCGKTTIARLASKYYLCENPTESGEPCGECYGCKLADNLIANGESDELGGLLREVNGTKVYKVDAVKQMIDTQWLPPPNVGGAVRVVILDECHRLSEEAQSAMLKVLEDIPKHLVVLLATTDPEKLLDTVKSRCGAPLLVKRQPVSEMEALLLDIARKENIGVSKRALNLIARKGSCIPRECITLMESVFKSCGEVTETAVFQQIDELAADEYIRFIEAALKSLESSVSFVYSLRNRDIAVKKFVDGLAQFVQDALGVRLGIAIDDFSKEFVKDVKELFKTYNITDFHQLLTAVSSVEFERLGRSDSFDSMQLILLAERIGKRDNELVTASKSAQLDAVTDNRSGAEKFVEAHSALPDEDATFSFETFEFGVDVDA
jgi:DNA polymerase-3 subunit gamma/tau